MAAGGQVTYRLVAIARDGTRHPLSKQEWFAAHTYGRRFVDATGGEEHRLSRKRAEYEASKLNEWDDVRRHGMRVVVEPVEVSRG